MKADRVETGRDSCRSPALHWWRAGVLLALASPFVDPEWRGNRTDGIMSITGCDEECCRPWLSRLRCGVRTPCLRVPREGSDLSNVERRKSMLQFWFDCLARSRVERSYLGGAGMRMHGMLYGTHAYTFGMTIAGSGREWGGDISG